jgi:hypothetical protein
MKRWKLQPTIKLSLLKIILTKGIRKCCLRLLLFVDILNLKLAELTVLSVFNRSHGILQPLNESALKCCLYFACGTKSTIIFEETRRSCEK